MNLETRARAAVQSLRTATPVDPEDGLRRLHRTHQRRTVGKVIAGVVAVVVGLGGVVLLQRGQEREMPISPLDKWVLVSGNGVYRDGVLNPNAGVGWSEPLPDNGVQTYEGFFDADPATGRFLVNNWTATGSEVWTPGRSEPLAKLTGGENGEEYDGASLGPGPDEVTVLMGGELVVVGPDGEVRQNLGPMQSSVDLPDWAPDGNTGAAVRTEGNSRQASLAVVLVHPDSSEVTTLYRSSEDAPPWFDSDARGYRGYVAGWGAPELIDLAWAPDSSRLAFLTVNTAEGAVQGDGGADYYQLQLHVAETATGEVDTAQLGPQDAYAYESDGASGWRCTCTKLDHFASPWPSIAWTPDGANLTVLLDSTLTTYDRTGAVLSSQPTDLHGPIVWINSK